MDAPRTAESSSSSSGGDRVRGLYSLLSAAICCLFLLAPQTGWAQRDSREAEDEIRRHLRDANDHYQTLELDQMDRSLEDAIELARRFPYHRREKDAPEGESSAEAPAGQKRSREAGSP